MAGTISPGNPEFLGGNQNDPVVLARQLIDYRGPVHSKVEDITYRNYGWNASSGQVFELYAAESPKNPTDYLLYVTDPGDKPKVTLYVFNSAQNGVHSVQDKSDKYNPGMAQPIYSDTLRDQLNADIAGFLQTAPPEGVIRGWAAGRNARMANAQREALATDTYVQSQIILGDLAVAGILALLDNNPGIMERKPAKVNKAIVTFMRRNGQSELYSEQDVRRTVSVYVLDRVVSGSQTVHS